jgi:ribosomal protein S18 acetylase RimI-like enzyme
MSLPILPLNLANPVTVNRLWYLQQQAYRVEAALIGFAEIPPLLETMEELQAAKDAFFGFYHGAALAGAIACETHDNALEITRLVVDPHFFRQGIAQKMLSFIAQQYSHYAIMRVSTGSKNEPALQLYLKNGFLVVRTTSIAPGIGLTHLERKRN